MASLITTQSSFNYFIYQGKESGYEYDMAKSFVDYINEKYKLESVVEKVKLKIIPTKYDELFTKLANGEGDIIAAGLTKTKSREGLADFSLSYNTVDEIIVSHKSLKIDSLKDLQGKTLHIRKSSSYFDSVQKINKELKAKKLKPITIEFVNEALDTESILELVSLGEYKLTVADSHLAFVGLKVFGHLNLNDKVVIKKDQPISWAFQKNSPLLKKEADLFLAK